MSHLLFGACDIKSGHCFFQHMLCRASALIDVDDISKAFVYLVEHDGLYAVTQHLSELSGNN